MGAYDVLRLHLAGTLAIETLFCSHPWYGTIIAHSLGRLFTAFIGRYIQRPKAIGFRSLRDWELIGNTTTLLRIPLCFGVYEYRSWLQAQAVE